MSKKRRHSSKQLHESDFIVSNNYIFYDRLKKTNAPQAALWNKIGKNAESELERNIALLEVERSRNEIADVLLSQAAIEKKKEINFLKEVFEIDTIQLNLNDYAVLINKLNELIGLKKKYKQLLTALNEGVGKTELQKKTRRGYGAAAYFDSYLAKHLGDKISSAMRSQKNIDMIMSGDDAAFEEFISKIIDDSIEKTIEEIAEKQTDVIGGVKVHMWKDIIKILDETEEVLYGRFKSELYKRYNLDNVKKEIRKFITDKFKDKKNLRGLKSTIRKSYNISTKAMRGVEGYIEEFFQAILPDNATITNKGTVITRRGTVLESNVAKTDTVSLYSADVDFNLRPLVDELNSAGHFHNLVETQEFLNNFNNKLQSMPDNFVIYESVKKYAINSDNFGGFHGGTVNIRDLQTMFRKTQNPIDVDKLMVTLLNTMNGAILTNGKEVRKKLSYALSSSVATFLFDDWESIGNIDNERALHIFILNSVRVPLSYFLYALGTAIKRTQNDPTSLIKFSFNMDEILYPDPIGQGENSEPFDTSKGIKGYWEEQKQKALEHANFSVTFLQNFNTLIEDLIGKLPQKI